MADDQNFTHKRQWATSNIIMANFDVERKWLRVIHNIAGTHVQFASIVGMLHNLMNLCQWHNEAIEMHFCNWFISVIVFIELQMHLGSC